MPRRKRAQGEAPHENEERWLLTYSDMITLLFVLFVVMYAISNTDLRKFTALAQSVQAAFNVGVMDSSQNTSILDETGSDQLASSGYDTSSGAVNTDLRAVKAALEDFAISQGVGNEITVSRVPAGIAIHLDDTLLFSPGRAHLDEQSVKILARVADTIRPLPSKVRVEGNTDDQPPSGGLYSDNWQLSTARALAVLDGLEALGTPPGRLSAAGYAEFNPLVPNTDDASRAKNRRVDVLLLYESAAPAATSPAASFNALGGNS